MTAPIIELVARRQPDLVPSGSDYHIYARDRLVGRIYHVTTQPHRQHWFWGLQGVFTSMEIGQLHGSAVSFDEAKARLRAAFDVWLGWALAAPQTHKSYASIRKDLQEVGALCARQD